MALTQWVINGIRVFMRVGVTRNAIIRNANASCPKAAVKWPTKNGKQNLVGTPALAPHLI